MGEDNPSNLRRETAAKGFENPSQCGAEPIFGWDTTIKLIRFTYLEDKG